MFCVYLSAKPNYRRMSCYSDMLKMFCHEESSKTTLSLIQQGGCHFARGFE
ncbi:unnamed protein product [Strongylus vulgaris]|uniref:Uncharacterized protein n=1 Tax=Strongylus vulgaris TaxID=40348 RepID=A0A3P7J0F9_STRVU|nr:unnamed protein product [Strongylus vulgaris]